MNWPWDRVQSPEGDTTVEDGMVQAALDAAAQQLQQMSQAVAAVPQPGGTYTSSTYPGTGNITFGNVVGTTTLSGTGLTYAPFQVPAPKVEFSLMKLAFDASSARYDAERKGVVLSCAYGAATVEVFIPMDVAQQVLGPVLLEAFK